VADEAEASKGDCGQNRDDHPPIAASKSQNSKEDDDGAESPQPNLPEICAEDHGADN